MHRLLYTRATLAIGERTKKGAAGIFVPDTLLRTRPASRFAFSVPHRSSFLLGHVGPPR
jgi:hypothetical protein